jgi:hypothetical protein
MIKGFMPHWDIFMNKVQSIASRVPYMVVAGNHEFWYNFSSYKHRFMMPGVGLNYDPSLTSGSGDNMYYEWGLPGLVHFAAINSETAVDTANFGEAQEAWMDQVLGKADANREETPWSIAHFHRPLYCSNSGECNNDQSMGVILRKQGEGKPMGEKNKRNIRFFLHFLLPCLFFFFPVKCLRVFIKHM